MLPPFCRSLVGICIAFGLALSACGQPSNRPLTDRRLLALVAGGVLPENVVHEINSRGLAFHPSTAYATMLRDAGATPLPNMTSPCVLSTLLCAPAIGWMPLSSWEECWQKPINGPTRLPSINR